MSPKDEDDVSLDEGSPPDSPKELEIVAFDATSATLKWKAPENVTLLPLCCSLQKGVSSQSFLNRMAVFQ